MKAEKQIEEKLKFLVTAVRAKTDGKLLQTENPSFLTKLTLCIIDLLFNLVCRRSFLDFGHKVQSSQLVEN